MTISELCRINHGRSTQQREEGNTGISCPLSPYISLQDQDKVLKLTGLRYNTEAKQSSWEMPEVYKTALAQTAPAPRPSAP